MVHRELQDLLVALTSAHTGSWATAVDDVTDPVSVASARDIPRVLSVVADDDGAVLCAKYHGAVYRMQVATPVHCTQILATVKQCQRRGYCDKNS